MTKIWTTVVSPPSGLKLKPPDIFKVKEERGRGQRGSTTASKTT